MKKIFYVQFTDPAALPPIEHSSRLFADAGWSVSIFGIASDPSFKLKLPQHPSIRVFEVEHCQPGLRQKLQYFYLLWILICRVLKEKPAFIYASDLLSCPIAWTIWKLTRIKIIYHEHDAPNDQVEKSCFLKIAFFCRRSLAQQADFCIVPQEQRLARFVEAFHRIKPSFCVWNVPRVDEIVRSDQERGMSLILYYHGSITRARLPHQLILAISRFGGAVRLHVAGYETLESQGYLQELIELSREKSGMEVVKSLGSLPRSQLFSQASKAHVGVALMPPQSDDINMRHMVGASNKPFDYMACGLPLLVSNLTEWVNMFVATGYARACAPDDVSSIEAALRWYLNNPKLRQEMGIRGQEKIQSEWNYNREFSPVFRSLGI